MNPVNAAVNGRAPLGPAASSSTSTTTPASTTTTSLPPALTQTGTPGAAPTAQIEDQAVFGPPAARTRPC